MATRRANADESVQEGCRWLNNPPSAEQLKEWFVANVRLPHPDLKAEDYVSGIVVIPNKEKIKRTVDGQIVDIERLSFAPYPQVDTRIRCFWDWMEIAGYVGEIAPVPAADRKAHLPDEVFSMTVPGKTPGSSHTWLGATYQVSVTDTDGRGGRAVMKPPPGTKTVPLHTHFGADVNAPMKAQTGAMGRALGFAGILILPGSGVSSAEDMQEMVSRGDGNVEVAAPPAVAVPVAEPETAAAQVNPEEALKAVAGMLAELETGYPETFKAVKAWAKERGVDLENPPPAALAPLRKQLDRKLTDARRTTTDA